MSIYFQQRALKKKENELELQELSLERKENEVKDLIEEAMEFIKNDYETNQQLFAIKGHKIDIMQKEFETRVQVLERKEIEMKEKEKSLVKREEQMKEREKVVEQMLKNYESGRKKNGGNVSDTVEQENVEAIGENSQEDAENVSESAHNEENFLDNFPITKDSLEFWDKIIKTKFNDMVNNIKYCLYQSYNFFCYFRKNFIWELT